MIDSEKMEAIQWARKMVQDRDNLRILDTETTDFDGEIVQIAIADGHGKTLLNSYVNPRGSISDGATGVHGITKEMVKSAPTWNDVCGEVYRILDGCNVVVYNVQFDRAAMINSGRAWNFDVDYFTSITWHCAMEWYAVFYGEWNDWHGSFTWQKLEWAAYCCDVEIEGKAHDALNDVLMTLGVVEYMAKKQIRN